MRTRIVTASAGTGKTTHLAEEMSEAVGESAARPEAIFATTFTKQAAAELFNRARTRLLRNGQGPQSQALLTARIGTVNSVCGSLVTDFALELGLLPELRVLDEPGADLALKRALASVVTDETSEKLESFRQKFDLQFNWQYEIQRLIEAARANGLDAEHLSASAGRSVALAALLSAILVPSFAPLLFVARLECWNTTCTLLTSFLWLVIMALLSEPNNCWHMMLLFEELFCD